jgi:hypothetical protein
MKALPADEHSGEWSKFTLGKISTAIDFYVE